MVNTTVSTGGSSTLAADTDCSISSPATNQGLIYNSSSKWANTNLTHNLFTGTRITSINNCDILQWNSSSSKWVNATVSNGGSSTLAADTDCSISTPATNQALIYNSSSKWSNTNLTHNLLTGTSIISINNGDILRWNGTQFVNSSTLTNDETILYTGIVVSTGITKTQYITQNTTITTRAIVVP